jgi:outer membrane protein OmpA-like peptidoglycan-associated protein
MRSDHMIGMLICVILSASCGGTTTFQGASSQPIVGSLPPPPPPPPPKAAPPPPPPRVEIRNNQIVISEKIQFDLDKATIKPASNSLLDEIVATFKKNPQIKKVSIDGFASNEGGGAFNKRLSDNRAKAVMTYLVGHGVEKDRVTAKGWGTEKPIADNSTEEGREKNRRVEFNILEQEVTKQKVEIDPTTGKETIVESSTSDVKVPETPAAPMKGASK